MLEQQERDMNRQLDIKELDKVLQQINYFQHKKAHKWTWYGWNSISGTFDKQSQIELFISSNTTQDKECQGNTISLIGLWSQTHTNDYAVQSTKGRPSVKQKRVDLQKLKDCRERENFPEHITQRRYLTSNQLEK